MGAIFNDVEGLLTHISKSRQYSTPNMSVTVQDKHKFNLNDERGI